MDERIVCKYCDKKIVPRLWHRSGSIVTYEKIDHLCPYCGKVQYVTGGGFTISSKILLVVLFLPILQIFLKG
jgi:hypothetical protein